MFLYLEYLKYFHETVTELPWNLEANKLNSVRIKILSFVIINKLAKKLMQGIIIG